MNFPNMGITQAKTKKETLAGAEVGTLSSEPADSQTLNNDLFGEVSDSRTEGLNVEMGGGDAVVVAVTTKRTVVETEVSVVRVREDQETATDKNQEGQEPATEKLHEDVDMEEDSRKGAEHPEIETEKIKRVDMEYASGKAAEHPATATEKIPEDVDMVDDSRTGDDGVLGAEKIGGNGAGEKVFEKDSCVLIQDNSQNKKVECNGELISLVVDVHGSLAGENGSKRKCGFEDDKNSLAGYGGDLNPDENSMEIIDSVSNDKGKKPKVNGYGEDTEEEEYDEEDSGEEDENHDFAVGDFVWGKIRSHPWWPGQIYDPSDASDYAAKFKRTGRLLVAYFGDGSFSWCSPSQLKPFSENFEEMSKQSNSKNFVYAVQKALDEISRIVEVEMICDCVSIENQIQDARPMNGGIKAGVLVPRGNTVKLLIARFEPEELLSKLEYAAKTGSAISVLELSVLKSWLAAFCRRKGGYSLPIYHESQNIEGLEDKTRKEINSTDESSELVTVPIQGPSEEEWLSSPGSGQTNKMLLRKCSENAGDRLYERRKKRSVAELLRKEMDVDPKRKKSIAKEEPQSVKSSSGQKERKGNDEAETRGNSSKKRRKSTDEISGSVKSAENDTVGGEEETHRSPLSREGKRNKPSGLRIEVDDKEEAIQSFASRERKKSKYLSPPYTSPKWSARISILGQDTETEAEKVSKIPHMGERMTRVAGQLIGSPPILRSSSKKSQEKLLQPSSQAAKQEVGSTHSMEVIGADVNVSEVLSEILSAAPYPFYLGEKNFEMIKGFISAFRSWVWSNGSNYKVGRECQSSKKHKPVAGNETNEKEKLGIPQIEQGVGSSVQANVEEPEKKQSPTSLILTFPPAFSLPSKNDLIRIYSKFGPLNEDETDLLYNSWGARVVFVKNNDAEAARIDSVEKRPFGDANINYRLIRKKGVENAVGSQQQSVDEEAGLEFIEQKLEMLQSMVKNSDGKLTAGIKASLKGGLNELLDKVSSMPESTLP